MISMRVFVRSLGFVSTIILARLLTPSDFGIVALAISFMSILQAMTGFGIDSALVSREKVVKSDYDTAWTITLIRGAFVSTALLSLTLFLPDFLGEPKLEPVMFCIAVLAMILHTKSIYVIGFQKELNFRREFLFLSLPRLISFIVTLIFAFQLRNYWALIIGQLCGAFVTVATSYIMTGKTSRLTLSEWRTFYSFSVWVTFANMLNQVSDRLNTILVSKILGTSVVGQYMMAREISDLPSTEFSQPIRRALFPGFAKSKSALSELKELHYTSTFAQSLIVFPAGFGLSAVSQHAVPILLGPQWSMIVSVIAVISVSESFRVAVGNMYILHLALGDTKTMFYRALFQISLCPAIMYYSIVHKGFEGITTGIAVSAVIMIGCDLCLINRKLMTNTVELISIIWRPLLSAIIMYAVLKYLDLVLLSILASPSHVKLLFIEVGAGASIYCGVLYATWILVGRPQTLEVTGVNYLARKTFRKL